MDNLNQNNQNPNSTEPSTWEMLRNVRKAAKEQKQIQDENERKRLEEKKRLRKEDKEKLKAFIKEVKTNKENAKKEYHKTVSGAKISLKGDKLKLQERLKEIKKDWMFKKIDFNDSIREEKFNYGKKHKTIAWSMTKWLYGLRKEFNRIVWSSPKNTFKYLGIIVFIVLLLSLIFFVISVIVNTFVQTK